VQPSTKSLPADPVSAIATQNDLRDSPRSRPIESFAKAQPNNYGKYRFVVPPVIRAKQVADYLRAMVAPSRSPLVATS
jgi:hypothetical protein